MLASGHDWRETKQQIEACLDRGEFRPAERLPAEPELCARFQTRRHSLRRAIEALAQDGRIIRHQGKGNFVAPPTRLDYAISPRTRYSENLRRNGFEPQSERLDEETRCQSPAHALRLGLA